MGQNEDMSLGKMDKEVIDTNRNNGCSDKVTYYEIQHAFAYLTSECKSAEYCRNIIKTMKSQEFIHSGPKGNDYYRCDREEAFKYFIKRYPSNNRFKTDKTSDIFFGRAIQYVIDNQK